jgi:hypothetical protein
MQLDLTDEETAALTRLIHGAIDADRYPLSRRVQLWKGNTREDPARAGARAVAAPEDIRPAASRAPAPRVKFAPGPPMALGGAAKAGIRIIVWCKACQHQVEPDPAEVAARYGAETTVIDWRGRLVCSRCGSRHINMVVNGTERRRE